MVKIASLVAFVLVSPMAFADLDQAPPPFPYQDGNAVFVNFQRASYHLVYDLAAKTVAVDSEIVFESPTEGYPIFDLVPDPTNVRLDDQETDVGLIADPDSQSKFRVLRTRVAPGSHRLTLSHFLTMNVDFRSDGVASAFWTTDLTDRRYLEQYLPANLLYDQHPISMKIEITNAGSLLHELRTNGLVTNPAPNVFEVEYPAFYTASSLFFHLSPADSIPAAHFTFDSVDGRKLPVEVYAKANLDLYVANVKAVLAELEGDYGPFPHPKVIVYGSGTGGMEYSGATIASPTAVGHELFHSYNARGVMPADGNSGWMDEAMSCWRDRHYATRMAAGGATKMAGHSPWMRITDEDAYGKGTDFLAWIAGRMDAAGKDFKTFLRGYLRTNLYHTVTTETLRHAMEAYSGFDLEADFAHYVYGTVTKDESPIAIGWAKANAAASACHTSSEAKSLDLGNPFHPRLTPKQLFDLL